MHNYEQCMYADNIILLAPSAKGLQRFLDVSYNYGCDNDILFNIVVSDVFLIQGKLVLK